MQRDRNQYVDRQISQYYCTSNFAIKELCFQINLYMLFNLTRIGAEIARTKCDKYE